MALVMDNRLTTGLRGKFGQLFVFRVMRGKTFASHAPRKPDKSKETAAQRLTRSRFREASRWARFALLEPEKKKYYQQRAKEWKLPNAYTAAIKEYMSNRRVEETRDQSASELRPSLVVKTPLESVAVSSVPLRLPDTFRRVSVDDAVYRSPADGQISELQQALRRLSSESGVADFAIRSGTAMTTIVDP